MSGFKGFFLIGTDSNLNHFALKYKLIVKANQIAFKELQMLQEKIAA